jgi:hypothetical protein
MSILIKKFQDGNKFTVNPDTTIHGGLVNIKYIPSNYKKEDPSIVTLPDGKKVKRTFWSTQSNEGKPIIEPIGKIIPPSNTPVVPTKDPIAYSNSMKELLSSGKKTVTDLVNEGKISRDAVKDYAPFEVKRDLYTDEEITPEDKIDTIVNNPETQKTVLYGGVNAYRKNVVEAAGNGYKAYDLPDETGNYTNKAKRVYAIGEKIIDPAKSTYDKNNKIIAHFTGETLPSEGVVNYIKPSDDGVTKQNMGVVDHFIQPGTSVNRNNFGGGGVNETTVKGSKNTKTFIEPKYDSSGKLILDTKPVQITKPIKEVGKMYNTKLFKKGGLMNCKCGCLIYKKKNRK